jgi:transposase
LTEADRQKLEKLFAQVPKLRDLHQLRVRFKEIFDAPLTPEKAGLALTELFLDAMDTFPELEHFTRTFETWREPILAYFTARQTSAAVEGINNKARVIIKRAYGLKSADSLWTRLLLDLNRAAAVVLCTIAGLRTLVAGLRAIFA